MPKWGGRVDVRGGIALCVHSRDVSAWIPAFAGMTNWGAGTTSAGAASFRHTRRRVILFSYQSLMPAAAGTPRYENWHRPHPSGFRRRIGVWGVLSPERRSGVAVWTYVVGSRLAFFRGMLVRGFPPSRERRLEGFAGALESRFSTFSYQ